MGMDVFGKAHTAPEGEYFRRSMWGWRPLADCLTTLAPDETKACRYWQSNDCDGLDAAGSIRLANKIAELQSRDMISAYVKTRDEALARLPDEPCVHCDGTGVRSDAVGVQLGMPTRQIDKPDHPRAGEVGWCNGCDGVGNSRHSDTYYALATQDLEDFRLFLLACGGFEIC